MQPSKLSNNLVQQFLLPDQTPPILEAEMSLRAQQLINNNKHIVSPEPGNTQESWQKVTPEQQEQQKEIRQKVTPEPQKQPQEMRSEKSQNTPQAGQKKERIEEVKQVEKKEERQEPEGRQADTTITEHESRRQV